MTTATAETCKYVNVDVVTYIECSTTEWEDYTKKWTYCPDCGRKVERVEAQAND